MVKNISVLSMLGDQTSQQTAIAEREQCYRAILEMTTDMLGMLVYRPDGTLIDCNQAFLDIIGYDEDDFKQLNLADIIPHKYGKCVAGNLTALKQQGRHGPYEEEYTPALHKI